MHIRNEGQNGAGQPPPRAMAWDVRVLSMWWQHLVARGGTK